MILGMSWAILRSEWWIRDEILAKIWDALYRIRRFFHELINIPFSKKIIVEVKYLVSHGLSFMDHIRELHQILNLKTIRPAFFPIIYYRWLSQCLQPWRHVSILKPSKSPPKYIFTEVRPFPFNYTCNKGPF